MRTRVISILLELLAIAALLPVTVLALLPEEGENSLTVTFELEYDGGDLLNTNAYLYYVGEIVPEGGNKYKCTPNSVFAECAEVEWTGLDWLTGAETLRSDAEVLDKYVKEKGIAPDRTGRTGVSIPNLPNGLYLVTGDPVKKGNTTYTPNPFLIRLPFPTKENPAGTPLDIKFKYNKDTKDEPKTDPTSVTVVKNWEPKGKKHPESLTVWLYLNGVEYSKVTLPTAKGWTYTWSNLPAGEWDVREEYLSDYTSSKSVQKSANGLSITFTFTNTLKEDPPPKDPPDNPKDPPKKKKDPPDDPKPDPTPDPTPDPDPWEPDPWEPDEWEPDNWEPDDKMNLFDDVPEDKMKLFDDSPLGNMNLPQTGQLWWPVPVLLISGVLMLLTGMALFVRKEKELPYEQ